MSPTSRTCRALAVLVVMITPAVAFGQGLNLSHSVSSAHRPWVGLSMGVGFLGGDNVEPDNSRDLGLSLDIPIKPAIRLRAGAGRMSVHSASVAAFPLRRLTFDAVALKAFPSPRRACQSHFVAGAGVGLYHYGLDHDFSETRRGYQVFAGGECVGRRMSFALEITGRPIRGPANLQLPDVKMFAIDMHVAVKLRL